MYCFSGNPRIPRFNRFSSLSKLCHSAVHQGSRIPDRLPLNFVIQPGLHLVWTWRKTSVWLSSFALHELYGGREGPYWDSNPIWLAFEPYALPRGNSIVIDRFELDEMIIISMHVLTSISHETDLWIQRNRRYALLYNQGSVVRLTFAPANLGNCVVQGDDWCSNCCTFIRYILHFGSALNFMSYLSSSFLGIALQSW